MANSKNGALFVPDSGNKKIAGASGRVSTTYASIDATCPDSCELKESGVCYAMGGHVGMVVSRLDVEGADATPLDVARAEAQLIRESFHGETIPQDGARGGRDLRLHTSGDARTVAAARTLASAAEDWILRGGGSPWSYTHAWRDVPRDAWGAVSILASVETEQDAQKAMRAGYAPARVVETHESAVATVSNGVRWIPCLAQTIKGKACSDCRLCLDADSLRKRGAGITFAAHGMREAKTREVIVQLGQRKATK